MSAPVARDLARELDEARTAALALLEQPGRTAVSAVAVLCNQLSAFTTVIAPQLPRSAAYLDLTVLTAQQHRALRALESQLCGDASTRETEEVHAVMHRVVDLSRRAGALERELLADLCTELGQERCLALLEKHARALHHGPTRPHPSSPRGRVLGGLSFRFNARRDRVMDVLDARTVPSAHPVAVHKATGRERRGALDPHDPHRHDDAGGTA